MAKISPIGLVQVVAINAVTHGWVWWKGDKKDPEYRGGKGWVGDI